MMGRLDDFSPSNVVEQELPLFERPIPKFNIGPETPAQCILAENDRHFLFDLGRESVGYLSFRLHSSAKQKMTIAYGEHIVDGGVRRLVGGRDFSVEYTLAAGENRSMNPFRRLGLRYLEVFCEEAVQIGRMGICPTDYPVRRLQKRFDNPLRQ